MRTSRIFLLLVLSALTAATARAQFAAPRSVDDIEMPADKEAPAPEPDDLPAKPASLDEDVYVPGQEGRGAAAAHEILRNRLGAGSPDAGRAAPDAGVADPGAGAAAPKPETREAQPIIAPPENGDAELVAAVAERQKALQSQNFKTAEDLERKIDQLRGDLGYLNMLALASALAREAEELSKNDPPEGVRRAVLAAALAPDLPHAHWSLARAAWADDKLNVGRYLGSSLDAVRTSLREPRWSAALLGDASAGVLLALLVTGSLLLLVVFLRHARYYLHDLHHLFPAGAPRIVTAGIGLLMLGLPLAFGVGPVGLAIAVALAVWLYMGLWERVAVVLFLTVAGLVPQASSIVATRAAFAGTAAEAIYLADRGGLEGAGPAAVLKRLSEQANPSFQVAFVAGRHARRLGHKEEAVQWLRRAAELRPASIEALTELGNALFLYGDIEGARDAYQRAIDRDPARPEPHFNLARLYARRAELAPSEEATEETGRAKEFIDKTIALDPRLGMRAAGELELQANRIVTGTPLPLEEFVELASADPIALRVEEQVTSLLFGRLSPQVGSMATLAAAAVLVLLSLIAGAIRPSRPCNKCGRPVCRRCDAEVGAGGLCGQCINLFNPRAAVDPAARAAKELGIRRYQRNLELSAKVLATCLPGGGHLIRGRTLSGVALLGTVALLLGLVLWPHGVFPVPMGHAPALLAVPAALTIAAIHFLAVRRVFRNPSGK